MKAIDLLTAKGLGASRKSDEWGFNSGAERYVPSSAPSRSTWKLPDNTADPDTAMLAVIEGCIAPLIEAFNLKLSPKGWVDLWDDLGRPKTSKEAKRRFAVLYSHGPP
ncbi:hypothetical protein LAJ19_10725 [Deinococcus taeanensis]|uniref:hypothetical protein n=1 Tax=Deinococcus taeanensis TaxID=2737050 RepID=UPI001CDCFC4F|nr:hypothetical protein [Deinococcus taeanensis]UBV42106.1 hypothetical protein LAJ19_10725 [Deinococcus taeanensis]